MPNLAARFARATMTFGIVATFAVCLVVASAASAGEAAKLPRAFVSGTGKSSVRPPVIINDSADGGELKIHWTSWTATQAVGHGTSYPDHGSSPIKLRLFAPLKGEFTKMTLSFKYNGKWSPRLLVAASYPGSPPGWSNAESVKSAGMQLWQG